MPKSLLAAAALAALAVGAPAGAQVRPSNPQGIQPVSTSPVLHQPSNLDLQLQLNQLSEAVSQLGGRLAALNQHIASLSGQLGTLNSRERDHFRKAYATAYQSCKLLYMHHWAPNGAHPTPGNPYVPDQYCEAQAFQDSMGE
jgi:TolA-binding protein